MNFCGGYVDDYHGVKPATDEEILKEAGLKAETKLAARRELANY